MPRMMVSENIRREIEACGYPLPRPVARNVVVGKIPFATTIKDNSAAEQSLTADAAFANAARLIEQFLGGANTNDKNVIAEIHAIRLEAPIQAESALLIKELRQGLALKSTVGGIPTTINIGMGLYSSARTVDQAAGAGTGVYNDLHDPDGFYKLAQPLHVNFREAFSLFTYTAVNISADLAATLWLDGVFVRNDAAELDQACGGGKLSAEEAKDAGARRLLYKPRMG